MSASPKKAGSRKEQAMATRSHIIRVALRLFAEHGFSATSTRKIAAEAGVSDGLIFHYFPNKLALLRSVATERPIFADLMSRMLEQASEQPVAEVLQAIAIRFVGMLRPDGPEAQLFSMLLSESRGNAELYAFYCEVTDRAVESLAGYFRARIDAGEIRRDLPTASTAQAFVGALVNYFATHRHLSPSQWKQRSAAYAADVSELLLVGIRG